MTSKNLKINPKTVKRVLTYTKKYSFFLVMSIILAALTVALMLYLPILTGYAIDDIIGKGRVDFPAIFAIIKKMVLVIGITALAQWLQSLCNNRMTYCIVRDIRQQAFEKIEILPLKYIDSHAYGDVVSRVISDVDQFADGLLMGFTQFFTGAVTIIATLCFMLSVNVGVTLVVVLITPLSFLVAGFIARKTYTKFRLQSEMRGLQTSHIEEMIGSLKVVQAFRHEKASEEKFDTINEDLRKASLKAIFYSSLTNPSTRFVNNLVYAGVGVTGALLALNGGITVGRLSCFLSYASQYTKPFNEISGVVTELQNALACATRIFELIDEPSEVAEADNAVDLQDVTESAIGNVSLKDVAFSYSPDNELITGLNLAVKQGERVAIVGPTGCGKTTIINLLMRFYDVDAGSIEVEGTDIRNTTRKSLRGSYGMVLQDTWLRKGTILDNILFGNPEATKEQAIEAAKLSHAHSFIKRLPKGYDTLITEDGEGLSQGQKQLLCITRVMLSLPPMLILDEATSSIDTRTEMRIQKAFTTMMEGRTSFIVAHRLQTIREADVILVMKNGKIVEQGSHDELIKLGGFYKELYFSQFN